MITQLLQLIAPDDCLECNQEGSLWCEWCRLNSEPLPSRCFKCHAATTNYDVCERCRRSTYVKRLYVAAEYKSTAKEIIAALKYKSMRQASKPIARALAEILPLLDGQFIVASLPTAPVRRRQRGFDHTEHIARELAGLIQQPYKRILRKTDNNRQVGATRTVRLKQAKNAYRLAHGAQVSGSKILLIDDVVTTGASLSEATKTLRQAGAKQVICAVFAYSK